MMHFRHISAEIQPKNLKLIHYWFLAVRGNILLGLGTHLFVKKPRPEDSEVTFSVYPVKCLAQGHNKRTCRPIFILTLLNAERQAGKL